MARNALYIGPLRISHNGAGSWRATARVGKKDVFFEADAALEPAPEAFATAFFSRP